jgi:hypothetical protein
MFGCQLNPKSTEKIPVTKKTNVAVIMDSCNYVLRKQKAQKLTEELKQKKDSITEAALTSYIVDSLFSCWYGTTWDFYGTTQQPGKGSIACGYFVTTVLRDVGIPLNRVKLAQCASEEMIKALTFKISITRFSNQPLNVFVEKLKKKEKGLYIIGLDFHTGFIIHNGEELYFIHASYAVPKIVRKERVVESGILAASKYKVIGKVNFNIY